jgi:hypothetical protein
LSLFDETGRRIPDESMRVFSRESRKYYKLKQPELDLALILNRIKKQNIIPENFSLDDFECSINLIIEKIERNDNYKNILKGVFIPFAYKRSFVGADLGTELVENLLPKLKDSFLSKFPKSEFKAILQSNAEMRGNITLDPHSRYSEFIKASEQRVIVGLYFPQALQEYDVRSQRSQMVSLLKLDDLNHCLAGGLDMCAALVGTPDILFHEDFYSPIPIMSAYQHTDSRMVLLLKAYGPHLEFWCMSQMLTKEVTQVSEQWTGGLTLYQA